MLRKLYLTQSKKNMAVGASLEKHFFLRFFLKILLHHIGKTEIFENKTKKTTMLCIFRFHGGLKWEASYKNSFECVDVISNFPYVKQ